MRPSWHSGTESDYTRMLWVVFPFGIVNYFYLFSLVCSTRNNSKIWLKVRNEVVYLYVPCAYAAMLEKAWSCFFYNMWVVSLHHQSDDMLPCNAVIVYMFDGGFISLAYWVTPKDVGNFFLYFHAFSGFCEVFLHQVRKKQQFYVFPALYGT